MDAAKYIHVPYFTIEYYGTLLYAYYLQSHRHLKTNNRRFNVLKTVINGSPGENEMTTGMVLTSISSRQEAHIKMNNLTLSQKEVFVPNT